MALEAHMLVHGDRGAVYDHPFLDYEKVVSAFNAFTGLDLEVAHGPVFMLCVKIARGCTAIDNGLPAELWRDSRVDTAGYAECWDGVVSYEPDELEDDDDEDDGGDDEPPAPLPMPDGGDAEKVEPDLPVLSAEPDPIPLADDEDEDVDIPRYPIG